VNHEPFKNVAEGISSIVTATALISGGIWACWRFVITREGKPLIQPELDIVFVHKQNDRWIVELVAFLENKGKARLEIKKFSFDLRYALPADDIQTNTILVPDVFQSQKDLKYPTHSEVMGQWLEDDETIILEPGIRYRHSQTASLPDQASTALFAIEFQYPDGETEMEAKFTAVPKTK
jgi:hypothetical protein